MEEESKQNFHFPPFLSGLKEREEIARAAYKTWIRIKPGHKEIKDRWWALYYKKIQPRFHLRDNLLGRKINSWIDEDLNAITKLSKLNNNTLGEVQTKNLSNSTAQLREQIIPNNMESQLEIQSITDDSQMNIDSSSILSIMPAEKKDTPKASRNKEKKGKPNSSKEGTSPAYLNIELIHPSIELIRLKENQEISEGTPEYWALKLKAVCENGNIDWDETLLESDVKVFIYFF